MKLKRITALSMAAAMAISAGVMANAADLTTADQPTSAISADANAINFLPQRRTVSRDSFIIKNQKTVAYANLERDKAGLVYYKVAVQNRSECGINVTIRKGDTSGPVVRTMYVPATSTLSFRNDDSSLLAPTGDYVFEVTPSNGSKVMNATIWYKTSDIYENVLNSLGSVTE